MTSPHITIIVPVYNGMPHLPETVDAILAQTYSYFTLRLINDGSTDGSAAYLDSLSDPRIQVVHKDNQGLCATLNYALNHASTDIIARCDQDDIWLPRRLEVQMNEMRKGNWDALFSTVIKFGLKRQVAIPRKSQSVTPFSFDDGCQVQSSMLAKRAVLQDAGGFDASFYPADDWELELRLLKCGARIGIIQEPLIKYRFHPSANTYRTWAAMQRHRRRAEALYFPETVDHYPMQGLNRSRKDLAKLFQRRGGEAYLHGYDFRAALWMGAAILLAPLRFIGRAWRMVL